MRSRATDPGKFPPRPAVAPLRRRIRRAVERGLLFAWLLLLFPAVASDVVRTPYAVSFGSDTAWSPVARPGHLSPFSAAPPDSPGVTPPVTLTQVPTLQPAPTASVTAAAVPATAVDGSSSTNAAPPQATVGAPASIATPAPVATATPAPTATPVPRYARGGIAFDAPEALTLAYPVSFGSDEWVRFRDLEVLMADQWGENYRRFVTEYDHQLFAYPETLSGTFVLSIHDGTLSSGRELEAEPLRRLIEGPLHNAYDLETIQGNLDRLLGSVFIFEQGEVEARFTVVQARRMSANDVAEYQYRAMELSRFTGPIDNPDTSFLVLFCSGRQPDEPRRPFPGRYVLVVEEMEQSVTPPADFPADTAQ